MLYITFCRYLTVGGVGIGSADVAVLAVDFADVLGEVPAVDVPGGILLDGQRARSGGHHTCRILLRERNAIHRHRFGGDVGGGNSAALNTFRILTILRQLRGSQAAFADKNGFALLRGRKPLDELPLHAGKAIALLGWRMPGAHHNFPGYALI